MKIDLHMHSYHSCDGEHSPTKLIDIAKKSGIDVVALTDHDTKIGVKEMMLAGERQGIKVIPAIEVTAQLSGDFVHILAYNIDPESSRFDKHLEDFEAIERASTEELIRMFQREFDFDVDFDEMMERCDNAIYSLVPLVEELVRNPKYHGFEDVKPYLPGGPRGDLPVANFYMDKCQMGDKFYIYLDILTYRGAIEQIHADGGIAVLAHPFDKFFENYEYLHAMKEAGLDGIEVFSNYHDKKQNEWYHNYAKENGLLVCGGSDYHGYFKPNVKMGEFNCFSHDETFKEILRRLL